VAPRGRHVAPRGHPSSPAGAAAAARGGGWRRAVSLVLMSAVLPGSAHLATGRRRAGAVILGIFLLVLALAATAAAVAWVSPGRVASYAVRPDVLSALRAGAVVLAVAWIAVVFSAVRLVPPGAGQLRSRLVAGVLALAVGAGIALPAATVSRYAHTTKDVVEGVFPSARAPGNGFAPAGRDELLRDGRINVLLVGADSGDNRTGLRADTVILASVDAATGKALLFSLPRNLQQVPFPSGSVMDQQWPGGFDCGNACLLNAVYEWAEQNAHLFPGNPQPGMTALRGAVSETLGLPVEYHVVVDLEGFQEMIDALGGITLRVRDRLPIGGGSAPVSGYIEPGLQTLDGYTALWYARSREGSDDYQRIDRQRCVMGAIARQADPANVLRNYRQVAASTEATVTTDIPQDVLPELVRVAFRVKSQPIESLTFTPPLIPNTADPDFRLIRRLVREAVVESETPPPSPSPSPAPAPSRPSPEPTATGQPAAEDSTPSATPKPAREPVPLDEVCSYT
jgi:polyisoprenyl-teichoic acid--peptidoglycan teichoic acid transferase